MMFSFLDDCEASLDTYHICNVPMNRGDAISYCSDRGSHLLRIDDAQERDYLLTHSIDTGGNCISGNPFWIDPNDMITG